MWRRGAQKHDYDYIQVQYSTVLITGVRVPSEIVVLSRTSIEKSLGCAKSGKVRIVRLDPGNTILILRILQNQK